MAQYELNLRDYLRIIHKRRPIIFITPFIIVLISIFTIPKAAVVYKASSTIKIEERKTIAGLLTEEIMLNPGDVMESETRFIKGYPVIKDVALKLGKVTQASSLEEINNAVGGLQGKVETEKVGNTNMIRITVTADTAKEAIDLANIIADVYIEQSHMEKAKQAMQARKFIEEQLTYLEDRTKIAEDAIRKMGEGIKSIKLAEPIEQKLAELQFLLAELSQRYTDKHPSIIQTKLQIKELESKIRGFSGQEIDYSRLAREVEVNKKLYAMLKERLEEARITEAQKVSDVSVVDPAVSASAPPVVDNKVKVIIGALLGLILGVAFAFIIETLDTSIGTIEDVENVVKLPVLGLVPSTEEELKKRRGLFSNLKNRFFPVYKDEKEERLMRLAAHYNPSSPITEAYRNIVTNLKLGLNKKTILITSAGPREGKSSVLCNLGIVMAQIGLKTLLVGADLRRPVLSKTFGIKKEPGLKELIMGTASLSQVLNNITDILLGDMKFEDVRKTHGIENIWIIPSGLPSANPVELLESKKMDNLIQTLKSSFDVILFDAPPVLPVTDASILAPKMDTVLIVYEIGRTSREALIRTKVQLESVGAKISGVVLNHIKAESEGISTYPYYYRYKYRYYGREERTDSESKNKK